jgi:hypothetical protein
MAAVASSIIALAGLAITATTTGISMSQKNKAKKAQARAETKANEAMHKARARLDVNYQEARSISKDPYEMAINASLQQGADAVQATRETQRASANVGRIQAAQNQMAEGQRVSYGQEMQALEKDILSEESRLRDIQTQLDLGEVSGAQAAAAYQEDMANQHGQDVMEGVSSMAQQGLAMAPLYVGKGAKGQKKAMAGVEFSPEQFSQFGNAAVGMGGAGGSGFSNMDFSSVGDMSNKQFRQFKGGLTPAQLRQIQMSPEYQSTLFPKVTI